MLLDDGGPEGQNTVFHKTESVFDSFIRLFIQHQKTKMRVFFFNIGIKNQIHKD